MLNVSGVWVERLKRLPASSRRLVIRNPCARDDDADVSLALRRREAGRSTRSAAAWLRAVEITAEPGHRNLWRVACGLRLLTTVGQVRYRA
jgi:hypothetical protein